MKKIVRLTEADLENIVTKILSEQSQGDGGLLPAPNGFFKVQGNSLFWTSDKTNYGVFAYAKTKAIKFP